VLFSQQKRNLKNKISEISDTIDNAATSYNWEADSVNIVKQDSIQQIKDSLNQGIKNKKIAEESSRIYDEKWYPKDSLSYVDQMVLKIIKKNDTAHLNTIIELITTHFKSPLQKARAIFFWIASTIKYDYETFNNNQVQPILQ